MPPKRLALWTVSKIKLGGKSSSQQQLAFSFFLNITWSEMLMRKDGLMRGDLTGITF